MSDYVNEINLCLDTIVFFSNSAETQIESLKDLEKIKPWFFEEADGRNYFYGIACIFFTYKGCLYESLENDDQILLLSELDSLIATLMDLQAGQRWTRQYIQEDAYWRVIRKLASDFLNKLSYAHQYSNYQFDIANLVNPDEFGGKNL